MTRFRVWAPRPDRVELALGPGLSRRRPMEPGERGWWALEVPEAGAGTDYAFVLDGSGPFPDPRSPWQPHGVHGASRLADPAAFRWRDAGWSAPPLSEGVIYELHVGTFTAAGTFDGAIERLDHLVSLGITHVELMPVAEFPGVRGWGYDGVDLYAPHHAYGGPDGLDRLVDACHARGLAVLLDVVYNHLGPDGNHLPLYGPYLTDRYRTPWGQAMNLDGPGSEEVRAFLVDNARHWLRDHHLDGLRLDAVQAMIDVSAVHVVEELASAVHRLGTELGRRLVVTAESDLNDPRLVRDPDDGGIGLDAQWDDDFRHSLHVALTGESDSYHGQYTGLPDLVHALRHVFVYDGRYSSFRGRRHGRPVGDLSADRFIAFMQNHDQAGNRALGERSGHLMGEGALRIGAAMVLLAPFVPLLFQGEEWSASTPFLYFTDHVDEDLAAAVRSGRREEFAAFLREGMEVPDPQAVGTFLRSKLDWSEPDTGVHAELLAWHRSLITLRRARPELVDGRRPDVRWDPEGRWLVMRRRDVRVAATFGPDPAAIELRAPGGPAPDAASTGDADGPLGGSRLQLALASDPGVVLDGTRLRLPGWSVGIVVPRA